MGRFWIGIGLLAFLLALGLYSAYAVEASHEPIAQALEQAAEIQDPRQAETMLQQARQNWAYHWHGTAALADHGPMDEIDSLFAQAQAYAKAGQMVDFSALCLRITQLIRATADEHQPTWWNFL